MTTEKVQSKIKSSTIAITVLSILLALAVASTIVLAAFTANKSASTTITFGGGITISVSGVYVSGSNNADTASSQQLDLVWGHNAGTSKGENNVNNIAKDVTFEAISITKGSSSDAGIYLIAKASIKNTTKTADETLSIQSGWTKITGTDWYVYGDSATLASATAVTDTNPVAFVAEHTIKATDTIKNDTFNATFEVYAADATADGLTALVTKSGYTAG